MPDYPKNLDLHTLAGLEAGDEPEVIDLIAHPQKEVVVLGNQAPGKAGCNTYLDGFKLIVENLTISDNDKQRLLQNAETAYQNAIQQIERLSIDSLSKAQIQSLGREAFRALISAPTDIRQNFGKFLRSQLATLSQYSDPAFQKQLDNWLQLAFNHQNWKPRSTKIQIQPDPIVPNTTNVLIAKPDYLLTQEQVDEYTSITQGAKPPWFQEIEKKYPWYPPVLIKKVNEAIQTAQKKASKMLPWSEQTYNEEYRKTFSKMMDGITSTIRIFPGSANAIQTMNVCIDNKTGISHTFAHHSSGTPAVFDLKNKEEAVRLAKQNMLQSQANASPSGGKHGFVGQITDMRPTLEGDIFQENQKAAAQAGSTYENYPINRFRALVPGKYFVSRDNNTNEIIEKSRNYFQTHFPNNAALTNALNQWDKKINDKNTDVLKRAITEAKAPLKGKAEKLHDELQIALEEIGRFNKITEAGQALTPEENETLSHLVKKAEGLQKSYDESIQHLLMLSTLSSYADLINKSPWVGHDGNPNIFRSAYTVLLLEKVFGCKSNKDRGGILDMFIKGMEQQFYQGGHYEMAEYVTKKEEKEEIKTQQRDQLYQRVATIFVGGFRNQISKTNAERAPAIKEAKGALPKLLQKAIDQRAGYKPDEKTPTPSGINTSFLDQHKVISAANKENLRTEPKTERIEHALAVSERIRAAHTEAPVIHMQSFPSTFERQQQFNRLAQSNNFTDDQILHMLNRMKEASLSDQTINQQIEHILAATNPHEKANEILDAIADARAIADSIHPPTEAQTDSSRKELGGSEMTASASDSDEEGEGEGESSGHDFRR